MDLLCEYVIQFVDPKHSETENRFFYLEKTLSYDLLFPHFSFDVL